MKIKKIEILEFTIPFFGNNRILPYYKLKVTSEDNIEKIVKTKEENGETFFTVFRHRYYFKNIGRLYSPKLELL